MFLLLEDLLLPSDELIHGRDVANGTVKTKMSNEVKVKKAICNFCVTFCRNEVLVKNNELVEAREDPDLGTLIYPPTCLRRLAVKEWFYHPNHLNYPLKRVGERGEAKWLVISWDQALDEIAGMLADIKKGYGAEAVATTKGTMRTADEYRSRFMNLFGSPNITGHCEICFGPKAQFSASIMGWLPLKTVQPDTRCVLLLGVDPSQSYLKTNKLIHDCKKAGQTKFICIDPRYTRSAALSDLWLQPRPGTDCALVMTMINIIIQEGLYHKEFVERWCYGFKELRERVAECTPDWAEQITWVPSSKIVEAARMYAQNGPAVIVEGMGVEQSTNIETYQARYILPSIMGYIDVKGGELLCGPHPKVISDREMELEDMLPPEQRKKQIGADRFKLHTWSGNELIQLNQKRVWGKPGGVHHSQNQAFAPLVYRAMITGKPYPVKALLTLASNPMIKSPNVKLVFEALKAVKLHVVCDYVMTPTAELADYVLPAASWLERPFLSTYDGSKNNIYAGERVLLASLEGRYDRRTDYEFWRGLSIRLGQKDYWPWETDEEVYDYRLAPLGYTFKEFMEKKNGLDLPPAEYKKYERIGFATPTGKVEVMSTILKELGYDPLPKYKEPPESPVSTPDLAKRYPLILITGARHQPFHHSEHRHVDSLRTRHPDPLIQINPRTARELGINDGDWVWIETLRGRVTQRCRYFEGIDQRVVSAQHGWWFPEEPGEEPSLHGVWKSNINVCTDDDPDICNPIMGTWPLKGLLCKVYKKEPG